MNLDNYTFDELIELKNKVNFKIYSFEDGYFYICDVRSYGRNWKEDHINPHTVQELCYQYFGDEGIVDVYTNNPNLNIDNYGGVNYFKSEEDYNAWKEWNYLTKKIPVMEQELDEWDNRDNVSFNRRPIFTPYFTRETVDEYKKQLAEYNMNFDKPVPLDYKYNEE
jgi:hypothetical protein